MRLLISQSVKILRRYRELLALYAIRGTHVLPNSERLVYTRGKQLEAYFTQPFYIAEPYTNKAGVFVEPRCLYKDVKKILDGGADEIESAHLYYIGSLMN
ncbi:hypothetical protein [Shouchella patagoniensis]|uniref:hypothetical protein n=1 Tax=Shouchella patagoniensis TaxID=228576 RepID=UPI003462C555